MKTPGILTVNFRSFSPQAQTLYSHFKDLWIENVWVVEAKAGEISIMRDFVVDVAHDYLESIVENENILESLETRDLAQAALGFLRGLLKPTKKGIYLNQIGSNATGSAEFRLGLLDSESDVAPSSTIANEEDLFGHGLDPLLVGFGVLVFSCGKSAPKRLRLQRRAKAWIKGDDLFGRLTKLSPSLNSNKVAELARIKPFIQKNDEGSEVYSLGANVTDTESNEHRVSVSDVNLEQGYIKSDDGTYIPFEEDLKSFNRLVLKDGKWQTGKMSEMLDTDFGEPFGHKYCMPMFMEEFRPLPESIPSLKETGFYSGGFGGVFDYLIIPMVIILLAIAPKRLRNLRARLVEWGLKNTTRPPYGAVLQMKAQGAGRSLVMNIFHEDSYILTAAPAVACLLQYLDGSLQRPGLWWQATLVEPIRFFEDIARFGVQVKKEIC
jgi:hypothetical protein